MPNEDTPVQDAPAGFTYVGNKLAPATASSNQPVSLYNPVVVSAPVVTTPSSASASSVAPVGNMVMTGGSGNASSGAVTQTTPTATPNAPPAALAGSDATDVMVGKSVKDPVTGAQVAIPHGEDLKFFQALMHDMKRPDTRGKDGKPVSLYGGKVDGRYGPLTVGAVGDFQKWWNEKHPEDQIKVDGKLGYKPEDLAETGPRLLQAYTAQKTADAEASLKAAKAPAAKPVTIPNRAQAHMDERAHADGGPAGTGGALGETAAIEPLSPGIRQVAARRAADVSGAEPPELAGLRDLGRMTRGMEDLPAGTAPVNRLAAPGSPSTFPARPHDRPFSNAPAVVQVTPSVGYPGAGQPLASPYEQSVSTPHSLNSGVARGAPVPAPPASAAIVAAAPVAPAVAPVAPPAPAPDVAADPSYQAWKKQLDPVSVATIEKAATANNIDPESLYQHAWFIHNTLSVNPAASPVDLSVLPSPSNVSRGAPAPAPPVNALDAAPVAEASPPAPAAGPITAIQQFLVDHNIINGEPYGLTPTVNKLAPAAPPAPVALGPQSYVAPVNRLAGGVQVASAFDNPYGGKVDSHGLPLQTQPDKYLEPTGETPFRQRYQTYPELKRGILRTNPAGGETEQDWKDEYIAPPQGVPTSSRGAKGGVQIASADGGFVPAAAAGPTGVRVADGGPDDGFGGGQIDYSGLDDDSPLNPKAADPKAPKYWFSPRTELWSDKPGYYTQDQIEQFMEGGAMGTGGTGKIRAQDYIDKQLENWDGSKSGPIPMSGLPMGKTRISQDGAAPPANARGGPQFAGDVSDEDFVKSFTSEGAPPPAPGVKDQSRAGSPSDDADIENYVKQYTEEPPAADVGKAPTVGMQREVSPDVFDKPSYVGPGIRLGAGVLRGIMDVGDTVTEAAVKAGGGLGVVSPETVKEKVANDQSRNKLMEKDYGGSAWYEGGRVGGQIIGSAPAFAIAGPIAGAAGEAALAATRAVPVVNRLAPALETAGRFIAGKGGVGFNPQTGEAVSSNLLTRTASRATQGAVVGSEASALTSAGYDEPLGKQMAGGALGGAAGGAIIGPAIAKAGKWLGGAIREDIGKLVGAPAKAPGFAESVVRNISDRLDKSGMSVADARAALREIGPEATLADVSQTMRTEATGLAKMGGGSTAAIKNPMEARAAASAGRAAQAIETSIGSRPDLTAVRDDFLDRAQQAAGPYYARAHASPQALDVRPVLARIDGQLVNAVGGKANVLKEVRSYLVDKNGNPKLDVDALHEARQAIDDFIEKAPRAVTADTSAGRNAMRSLTGVRNDLDAVLKTNPDMRAGDKAFAGEMKQRNALDMGTGIFEPKVRVEDVRRAAAAASPAELDAMRQGALSAVWDKLENASRGELQGAEQMFGRKGAKTSAVAKLEAVFPGQGDQIVRTLRGEAAMRETEQKTMHNSVTGEVGNISARYAPKGALVHAVTAAGSGVGGLATGAGLGNLLMGAPYEGAMIGSSIAGMAGGAASMAAHKAAAKLAEGTARVLAGPQDVADRILEAVAQYRAQLSRPTRPLARVPAIGVGTAVRNRLEPSRINVDATRLPDGTWGLSP